MNGKVLTLEELEHSVLSKFHWETHVTAAAPILKGNWLIKNVFPRRGLGVGYGRPGCGKSGVFTDIALHIASGRPWRGIKTQQGGVSYVSSEAGRMGVNRVHAWCRRHATAWPPDFRLSPVSLDLRSSEDDVRHLATDIARHQKNCVLIVIDTLNRSMAGGNENSAEDMGQFIRNVALLESLTRAFVLIVHHSGKDEARGSRGHSSLQGAIDFEGEVKREQGEPGVLRITKLRDGMDGGEFGFDIHAVDLGHDEDGDPVTAPVAAAAEIDAVSRARGCRPQGKNQKTVCKAFAQFVDDNGVSTPQGTGFPTTPVEAVNDAAFQEFAAGKFGEADLWKGKKAVREALDAMIERRIFCRNGGLLWKI